MDGELEAILAEVRRLSAQEREALKASLLASLRGPEEMDDLATQEICMPEIVRVQAADRGSDKAVEGIVGSQ